MQWTRRVPQGTLVGRGGGLCRQIIFWGKLKAVYKTRIAILIMFISSTNVTSFHASWGQNCHVGLQVESDRGEGVYHCAGGHIILPHGLRVANPWFIAFSYIVWTWSTGQPKVVSSRCLHLWQGWVASMETFWVLRTTQGRFSWEDWQACSHYVATLVRGNPCVRGPVYSLVSWC